MNHKELKSMKSERVMELFYRAIKGESLSVKKLSEEYHVSSRSITRDINEIKTFLAEHIDTLGYADLEYSSSTHTYSLKMDMFLSNKELLAITKVLIGSRAFNHADLTEIIKKLKKNTTYIDRNKLESLISKEMFHYKEIGSDCSSVIDNIWKITDCIDNRNIITVTYMKINREQVKRDIIPVTIIFCDYYFYLIAYRNNSDKPNIPLYFRIDRIKEISIHREQFKLSKDQIVNEGLLRQKSQFMWPGPSRKIVFEFSGPSVQAILDRIPTAKVIEHKDSIYTLEAEVYGDGIKMFLISQGSWVKVLKPSNFKQELKDEINRMANLYR